jgi:glutathione reductase (NADPH)
MAEFDTDLFVIGGGSGGVRAARIAALHGARVMIAEEYRMGGTCVIRGCVPKKLLVYASHIHHEIEDAAGFGWTIPQVSFDWPTLIANKDKEIARLEAAYTANVEKAGARVVKTRAEFEDAHTLKLASGERVRSKYVLIATGGAPNHGAPIRHRTRDFLERGLPSSLAAQAHPDPGRRLYRAGIRLHLCRLRFRCDGGLSRRQRAARFR